VLHQLLFLQPGDIRRLLPFFVFYLLLFAMLNVGDGLSLALFVHRLGAGELPFYYGLTAVINLILVALYMIYAHRISNWQMFRLILGGSLLTFMLAWLAILFWQGDVYWFGTFFIARELSFTLVIMHFGTFLQDYFTRVELNRILPIVYAGGRLGGVLGGLILALLTPWIGTLNLVGVYLGLGLLSWVVMNQMKRPILSPHLAEEALDAPADTPESFKQFFFRSPLLFWMSFTTLLFILYRWILNYQYNAFFEGYFPSEAAMAEFLGWYTAIALTVSMLIQLFVINRVIAGIGLKGAHFVFSLFLLGGMGLNLMPMTLTTAVFSRLLETEFRVGFRNPVHILITNLFPRIHRTRARAWLMGAVMPLGTLLASITLQFLQDGELLGNISAWGAGIAVVYFIASFGLYRSFSEPKPKTEAAQQPAEESETA
jgi:ATP/ADP translocase